MKAANGLAKVFIDGAMCADPLGEHLLFLTPTQYEDSVQKTLDTIKNSETGKIVFSRFGNRANKTLTIYPTPSSASSFQSEEETLVRPTEGQDMGTAFAYPQSSCEMFFLPQAWSARNIKLARGKHFKPQDAALTPDAVLLHELIHAWRYMLGLNHAKPMFEAYDNDEEVFAILITNIYCSELGLTDAIRGDHRMEFHQEKTRNMLSFYSVYQEQITRLVQEMRELTEALGEIQCDFNPLRQYHHPELYMFSQLTDKNDGWLGSPSKMPSKYRPDNYR